MGDVQIALSASFYVHLLGREQIQSECALSQNPVAEKIGKSSGNEIREIIPPIEQPTRIDFAPSMRAGEPRKEMLSPIGLILISNR